MSEPESVAARAAQIFRNMADRIMKNVDEPFGGAFVAVPPDGQGPVEIMVSDNKQNMGQFWGMVQANAAMAIREADETSRRQRGFSG